MYIHIIGGLFLPTVGSALANSTQFIESLGGVHTFRPLLEVARQFQEEYVGTHRINFTERYDKQRPDYRYQTRLYVWEGSVAPKKKRRKNTGWTNKPKKGGSGGETKRVEIFKRLRLSEVDTGELIQLIETDAKRMEGYDKGQLRVTEINLLSGGTRRQQWHADVFGAERPDDLKPGEVDGSLIYALSEKCRLHLEGERTAMITPGFGLAPGKDMREHGTTPMYHAFTCTLTEWKRLRERIMLWHYELHEIM
jgi:hypothetical protein